MDRDYELARKGLAAMRDIRDRLIELKDEASVSGARRVDLRSGPSFSVVDLDVAMSECDQVIARFQKLVLHMDATLRLQQYDV